MDAVKDLKWVLFMIFALWMVWFFTGGPERQSGSEEPFLKPPAPLDTGESYGKLPSFEQPNNKNESYSNKASIFQDKVFLSGAQGAKESSVDKEYIVFSVSARSNGLINITGWTLRNSKGKSFTIGKGVKTLRRGEVNTETPIYIKPGEEVFVNTGSSPVGVSFSENICSGYLGQFQNFTPPLERVCPKPELDASALGRGLDQTCINYISTLSSCATQTNPLPAQLSSSCVSFIQNEINYNSCVDTHKDDTEFFTESWRVYLSQDSEIWDNKSDLIRLYDQRGRLVGSLVY